MSDVWRVLVTGPVTGLEDWLAVARDVGWEAHALPLVRVVPVDAPELDAVPLPDWIAVTSSNALGPLVRASATRSELRGVRLAAIGDATAERALQAGLNPVLIPPGGGATAAGLARELVAASAEGTRVLWPRGDKAHELGEALRAAGRVVDDPIVYRTEPVAISGAVPEADAVFFASPSAVRSWVSSAPSLRPAAIAIGWTTYDELLASEQHFSTLLPLTEPSTAAFRLALESFFPSV
ncbi:MAG: uroporphyrinogen-III synthase [bacterium]|nr:uroporphyrinogen-III synthase [bacterium]